MWLLLGGCFTEVHTFGCESSTYDVDDDERVGDLPATASDVLDVVVGSFAFGGAYEGGGAVTGLAEVVRGGGSAVATDARRIEHTSRGPLGLHDLRTTQDVVCEDQLVVPVDVSFATDDGAVALSMDAVAFAQSARPDREPERFEVSGEVDPGDVDAMPPAPDATAAPGLALQWAPDGALSSVSLWWDGADYAQVLETD